MPQLLVRISGSAKERINKRIVTIRNISIPIAISAFLTWYFQGVLPYWVWAAFGAFAIVLITIQILLDRIIRIIWFWGQRKRLRKQKVAILKEEHCPLSHTRFEAEDWQSQLDKPSSTISIEEITDEYAAIVNPYGETYPEKSILNPRLGTFEEILSYVSNGGIFVCAGGYPFFYAYHPETERQVPMAEYLTGYKGVITESNVDSPQTAGGDMDLIRASMTLQPVDIPGLSLTDTLLNERFNLKTTLWGAETRRVHQNQSDQELVGDLVNVGGTDRIVEFRALVEPASEAIPLLRNEVDVPKLTPPGSETQTVYPMAAVPYNEGYIITAGIKLEGKKSYEGHTLDKVGFQKVTTGVENFLDARREMTLADC